MGQGEELLRVGIMSDQQSQTPAMHRTPLGERMTAWRSGLIVIVDSALCLVYYRLVTENVWGWDESQLHRANAPAVAAACGGGLQCGKGLPGASHIWRIGDWAYIGSARFCRDMTGDWIGG